MKQYRDFENDPVRYSYSEGAEFLARLHENKQHYVPIIDSAIYAPNPENASDAYPPFDRGVSEDAFILNPDKSLYIGEVWPGYTGRFEAEYITPCGLISTAQCFPIGLAPSSTAPAPTAGGQPRSPSTTVRSSSTVYGLTCRKSHHSASAAAAATTCR